MGQSALLTIADAANLFTMTSGMETFVVLVFVLSYLGIALGTVPPLALDRTGFALLGAIILVAGGALTIEKAIHSIDTSTILLLYALMVISGQLRLGGFYTWVALKVSDRVHSPKLFLLLLMLVAGGLSAVLTNDVVCLAFTPVVCVALIRARLNPIPFLLGLAMSANIGSASTIIGNPQNMLIGQVQSLDFADFIVHCVPPSIVALIGAFLIISVLFRGKWHSVPPSADSGNTQEWPVFNPWQTAKGLMAITAVMVLFFTPLPRELVAITAAGLLLMSRHMRSRWLLGFVDWHLLTLFCGLFIIIAAITETGIPSDIVATLREAGIDLRDATILSAVSVLLSNLVSNVPATMLLLKFVDPGTPIESYALALSSTYAGNLITIGSIANLIVIEQARQLGVEIRFREYLRAGVPVTLCSLVILFIWLTIVG